MSQDVLALLTHAIQPAVGRRGWHGGPTPLGAVRGVSADQAGWKPAPQRKSIWALTLHITYWKYAVRRRLRGIGRGQFPRSPSNWPTVPSTADAAQWAADVALLRQEHELLLEAVGTLTPAVLGKHISQEWTIGELVIGLAAHDAYHTGQIQLLKRLWQERRALARHS